MLQMSSKPQGIVLVMWVKDIVNVVAVLVIIVIK